MTAVQVSKVHRVLKDWAMQYGAVFTIRLGYIPVVIVSDPRLMPPLLKLPRSFVYNVFDTLTLSRPNIFTRSNTDPVWKAIRKAVSKVFTQVNLQRHFPSALAHMTAFAESHWALAAKSGAPIEMTQSIKTVFVHMLGELAFEIDLAGPSRDETVRKTLSALSRSLEELQRRANVPTRQFKVWDASVRQGRADIAEWTALISALADEALSAGRWQQQAETSESDPSSIVAALGSARLADGSRVPREQAIAEIATFFFVGTDTTSNTLAWTLLLLSQYPACRARVAAELQAAGLKASGDTPARPLTFADLSKLPYINACLQESMRLEPTDGSGTWRDSDRDLNIGGYFVPKGTVIGMPFYATFTSPDNFPDPMRYNPDRWLAPSVPLHSPVTLSAMSGVLRDGAASSVGASGSGSDSGGVSKCPVHAHGDALPQQSFPFSLGERNCVGRALAQMQMMMFMATLFSRFDIELATDVNSVDDIYEKEVYAATSGPPFLHLRILAAPTEPRNSQA